VVESEGEMCYAMPAPAPFTAMGHSSSPATGLQVSEPPRQLLATAYSQTAADNVLYSSYFLGLSAAATVADVSGTAAESFRSSLAQPAVILSTKIRRDALYTKMLQEYTAVDVACVGRCTT
jgi:hypothetical protein